MATLLPFTATLPQFKKIKEKIQYLERVKTHFDEMLGQGLFAQTSAPAMFVYRILTSQRSHTGLIAYAALEDYFQGKIKIHEHTLETKEVEMRALLESRRAHLKPLLLTYPNVMELDAYINRLTVTRVPDLRLKVLGATHFFWKVEDEAQLQFFQQTFAQRVPALYIADGHHRAKSAALICEHQRSINPNHTGKEWYNYILASVFASSQMDIHNYNRVVTNLGGKRVADIIKTLAVDFHVSPSSRVVQPAHPHEFGCYGGKRWYALRLREEVLAAADSVVERLDAHLLNKYVFEKALGIADVRHSPDIRYISGTRGIAPLKKAADETGGIAFNLYPLPLEDFIAVSDVGMVLPPKSTWFEPRMRSGLVISRWD